RNVGELDQEVPGRASGEVRHGGAGVGVLGRAPGSRGRERASEAGERVPGKSQRLLCSEATVDDLYEFVEAEKATYSIVMMCTVLGIARASFYRWLQRKDAGPTKRRARHQDLVAAVKAKVKATKGM